MPASWTRAVLRHRIAVLVCWAAVLGAGLAAATQLPSLLSNSFTVPGTESERAAALLARHFGERPESTFVVVFPVRRPSDAALAKALQRRLGLAARRVPTARARKLQRGGGILYGDVVTGLELDQAKSETDVLRRALRSTAGPAALVTGQPAIEHDLEPVLASDLRRGELIAVPVALLVLCAVLGLSAAALVPFVFAACTIAGALGAVYLTAHGLTTTSYVTNLVVLIGFGLAVDYSLLLGQRYREELSRGSGVPDAIAGAMETAGRTVAFSGAAVAVALGLLLFVPVPFVRSLGVGALFVPLISIAGAVTLQPVLLSLVPPGRRTGRPGWSDRAWERFARRVVRRRRPVLLASTSLLLLLALPALWIRLVPGSFSGIPPAMASARGLAVLRDGVGPGAVTPTEIVVDAGAAGRARSGPARRAVRRLSDELFHDPEVLAVASGRASPYTDPTGRFTRVGVVGRHEYGAEQSQELVRRLRDRLVPAAGFPGGTTVAAGGAPPQGVDFLAATYGAFPWLGLGVLGLTYLILLRAFRSLVLPLEAVLSNVLTVAAVYGVLVAVFQWGIGDGLLGVRKTGAVEGWIPVFLFACLFGLSMDYEVFLVMRMREAWDRLRETDAAVVAGIERTGRIVTAAALVMVAAFLGFVTGEVPGLQQLGIGLALAVALDATVVRMLLVPSLVAVAGRWNWWLPEAAARLARVPASPLQKAAAGEERAPSPAV